MTANSDEGAPPQLRPDLWTTINERYPSAMINKDEFVPLARLKKPLSEARLAFVSSARQSSQVAVSAEMGVSVSPCDALSTM